MGVSNIDQSYFVVWTPHGHIVEHINFDSECWTIMKEKIAKYYDEYYLTTIFDN